MRTAATENAERQASMPFLAAVRLTDTTLTLILSEATDLPSPWQGNADRRSWSIAADVPLEEVGPHVEDQLAPWPLLATIGMDEDGARWLLNLEDRHLLVTGDHTYGLDLASSMLMLAVFLFFASYFGDGMEIARHIFPALVLLTFGGVLYGIALACIVARGLRVLWSRKRVAEGRVSPAR